jgi:molecular chaperone HscA
MPMVRAAVSELFGREVLTNVNPDEVVALGAAIQANALAGNSRDGELLLLDVIALSLGLETMGGLVERVIERNTTIPVAKAQDFTTFKDGQTAMAIHVVQGERELVADCRSAGALRTARHPADGRGRGAHPRHLPGRCRRAAERVGARAGLGRRGLGGRQAELRPGRRADRADAEGRLPHAEDDMAARALREARVEAERMVLATHAALQADGDLLTAVERRPRIEALIDTTRSRPRAPTPPPSTAP